MIRRTLGGLAWAAALGICSLGCGGDAALGDAGPDAEVDEPGAGDAGAVAAQVRDASPGAPPTPGDAGSARDAAAPNSAVYDAGHVLAAPRDPATPGNDAPVLERLGFFNDELGPRIVLGGRDPNGDVASYTLRYYKAGAPAQLDMDGDGVASESEGSAELVGDPAYVDFAVRLDQSLEVLAGADQVRVIVTDAMGNPSAELSARLGQAPLPTASAPCDGLGFVRCGSGKICGAQNDRATCLAVSQAVQAACGAPLTLSPPELSVVQGELSASRWDPPISCLSGDPTRRPDSVIKVRLASAAARVRLDTTLPATNFDSILYSLPACTTQRPPTCLDGSCCLKPQGSGFESSITLTDLAADTDYFVVVDAFSVPSGLAARFEVTATIEE